VASFPRAGTAAPSLAELASSAALVTKSAFRTGYARWCRATGHLASFVPSPHDYLDRPLSAALSRARLRLRTRIRKVCALPCRAASRKISASAGSMNFGSPRF
jgi:hypothetical protein